MDQSSAIWASAQCGFQDWQLLWGDPWLSGTILVSLYALACLFLFRGSKRLTGRERTLWILCGVICLLQALNTPMDLHRFVWAFGKCLSKAQGWYDARDEIKTLVLIALLAAACASITICTLIFRRSLWNNKLLITGILIAVGATGIRGVSSDRLAEVNSPPLGSFHIANWIELLGLALVLCAVLRRMRSGMTVP